MSYMCPVMIPERRNWRTVSIRDNPVIVMNFIIKPIKHQILFTTSGNVLRHSLTTAYPTIQSYRSWSIEFGHVRTFSDSFSQLQRVIVKPVASLWGDLLLQAAQPIQDHLFDLGDNQVATLHDYLQVRHHEAWRRGRRSSLSPLQ